MPTLLDRIKDADFSPNNPDELEDDFPPELRGEIAPDPAPGKPRGQKPTKPPAAPRARVTAATRKRVKDELEAYTSMVALAWSVRDDHCGPVLNDQAAAIADSLADIVARNPTLLRALETSGVLGDWMKLALAIMPVVSAVRDHHIVKRVDEGVPDAPAPDWSRYTSYQP